MSGSTDRVEQLLDNYDQVEGDRRWAIIDELEHVLERHPERVLPYTSRFLNLFHNSSGGLKTRLGKFLQNLIQTDPEVATGVLEELGSEYTSDGEVTRETYYQAVETLSEVGSNDVLNEVSANALSPLLQGKIDQRIATYNLLARIGGTESVKILLDWRDDETGAPEEAAADALEVIHERAVTDLNAGEDLPTALKTLQLIAADQPDRLHVDFDLLYELVCEGDDDVATTAADILVVVSESPDVETGLSVWQLVTDLDKTDLRAHGRVVGAVAAGESAELSAVISELVDRLTGAKDRSEREQLLAALIEAGRIKSSKEFPKLDHIVGLSRDAEGSTRALYMKLFGGLTQTVADPGSLIPELLRGLQSEDPKIRRAASHALSGVNLYPTPDALAASQEDPDPDVQERVDTATNQSAPEGCLPLRFDSEEESRLLGLQASLKYATVQGRWDPIEFDEYHQALFRNLAMMYQSGGSGRVLLPYYVPHAGVLVPLELALQGAHQYEGVRVAVYTPGTSVQWGTLKDFRKALSSYGFGEKDNISGTALPATEWLTVSRVQGDSVTPYNTDASGPNEVVLTKSLEGLAAIDAPDVIVCNLQAHTSRSEPELIDAIRDVAPETSVVFQYSFFTKHDAGYGWPRYGYPEEQSQGISRIVSRLPAQALGTAGPETEEDHIVPAIDQARAQICRLSDPRSFMLHSFGAGELIDHINGIYEKYVDLDEPATEELAGTIRSRLFNIQRLSVPTDLYNEWVREESVRQGRYSPETTEQLLHSLDQLRDQYEQAYVPATVSEVIDHLEAMYDALSESNPKFTYLTEQLTEATQTDERIAIVFLSGHMQQVFEYAIRQTTSYTPADLEKLGVYLSQPDQFRDFDVVDRVLLPADVPPPLANYYFAPNAEKLELLTYGTDRQDRLEGWIDEQATRIHDQLGVPNEIEWPAQPELNEQPHGRDVEETEKPSEESPFPDVETFQDTSSAFTATGRGMGASGGPEAHESGKVRISTTDANEVELDFSRSVLLKKSSVGENSSEFTWITAHDLVTGDTVKIIPDSVRQELYQDALSELYGEGPSGSEIIESLETWWSTMREIYSEYENIGVIYSLLDRHGIDKTEGTVRDWFRAVMAADEPIDLVENPDLTIGPDSTSDIYIIGQAFEKEEFTESANIIQNVMKRFRKENRDQGRELNQQIANSLTELDADISSRIVTHTIEDVTHQIDR
ncbi:hypothetical protein [Natranaeroarchaeum aerophilus]|uniref:HEAT repeat domain-containing protein n=1 Tax=Natranaeroarchaeum aerophilus TaxID=2917711 RepID=A0AAE3FSD9_9EURY|nr:hypothetical protein [Natranaeroarchaeum aerophilus]MCL9814351.1 hypothetical protein [Natranaeroarchaeum aerophilus]